MLNQSSGAIPEPVVVVAAIRERRLGGIGRLADLAGDHAGHSAAAAAGHTRSMPAYDNAEDAANAARRTAALLRDARGVQRRLDKLAAGMADASAPAQRSLGEARDAVTRVITELAHAEHAQRRATQHALRRRR